MTTPINYDNAKEIDTQMSFPEFFEIIRNHRAYILHAEFEYSLTSFYTNIQRERRSPEMILSEYFKEKRKLMKLLQPYKHLCKQPGLVIDKVLRGNNLI